jgi:HEAT repeat protein
VEPQPTGALASPADILLDELVNGEISGQLDAISYLIDVDDPRVVPALVGLLQETSSEQVVEAIAEVFSTKGDPRASPALREAVERDYDPFLELSIAEALVACGDDAGYRVMIKILRDEEAGFARVQAIERIVEAAGEDFGYQSDLEVEQNRAALEAIDAWLNGL